MSFNIDHSRNIQYTDNIVKTVNQFSSKFRGKVIEKKVRGKQFTVERLTDPNETLAIVASRHADTSLSDLEHSRRVINLTSYSRAVMIDDEDKIRMLADPTSDYVQQLAGEFGRTVDDLIIDKLLGDSLAGETGGTTVSLPAAQQIAHGSTGLSVDKLKEARKILMANDVDLDREELYLAVNAEGYEDLLKDSGVESRDFIMNTNVNTTGTLPLSIAGFKIFPCERITSYTKTSAASTNRPAIAFAKSALQLGIGMDMSASIDRRADKNNNTQVLLKATLGAGRIHEEKVVDIRFQE